MIKLDMSCAGHFRVSFLDKMSSIPPSIPKTHRNPSSHSIAFKKIQNCIQRLLKWVFKDMPGKGDNQCIPKTKKGDRTLLVHLFYVLRTPKQQMFNIWM